MGAEASEELYFVWSLSKARVNVSVIQLENVGQDPLWITEDLSEVFPKSDNIELVIGFTS